MGKIRRVTVAMAVAMTMLLAGWTVLPSVSAQQRRPSVPRRGAASIDAALSDPVPNQVDRLREGIQLTDQMGTFTTAGDRIAFQPVDKEYSLGVLENLALERVWKMLDDARGRQWAVSGTVTEYRGRSFLLLNRAVLRSRAGTATAEP